MTKKFKLLLAIVMLPVILLVNGCKLAFWEKEEEGTFILEKVSIYMTQEHSIQVEDVSLTQLGIYKIAEEGSNSLMIGGYSNEEKTIYVEGFKRSEDSPLVVLANTENEDNVFEAKENYTVRLSYTIVCKTSGTSEASYHFSQRSVDFNVKIGVSGKKYVKEMYSDVHNYTIAAKLEFKKIK